MTIHDYLEDSVEKNLKLGEKAVEKEALKVEHAKATVTFETFYLQMLNCKMVGGKIH